VIAVYLVLVPVMVFFFLKDKQAILGWVTDFLPRQRSLVDQVWSEVLGRTGDYARGKVYEIIIVGCTAWITFYFLDLRFAGLLAVITGLSVIIPYIGAAVVTLPVAFVAFFQWGAGSEFLIAVGAYLVLQALDGNVLVPLLFSEVVKLHPNAIILSILIFGGIWGFWGVFFAIPLATLAHAVIKAWPRQQKVSVAEDSG
jgi:putative permease